MLIVKDLIISTSALEANFACDLTACKGACCWEGDWGAPLEEAEVETLKNIYPEIQSYLTDEGRAAIEKDGVATFNDDPNEWGTTLVNNGACAFMTFNKDGIALCGIEQAYRENVINFIKPISCHLYPIRVQKMGNGLLALNYDQWDICDSACKKGEKEQIQLLDFVAKPLKRLLGDELFEEAEAAIKYYNKKDN